MTARTWKDWHLVGESSDPVPADRYDVDALARAMGDRAADASEMATLLRNLSDLDDWRGKAADEFGHRSSEVVGNLEKVADRYSKVKSALDWWADQVDLARGRTYAAVTDAESAESTRRSNPEVTGDELTPEQTKQNSDREQAERDLQAARTALANAMSDLDDAAETAKDKIEDAADTWDDGWLGDFKGFIRDHADLIDIICKVLEVVALALAVVALVAAVFLTGGAILFLAAVVIGALLVVARTALVVADTGKATWEDVAWDVAGLALTLVGGKLVAKAAQGLKALVPTIASRLGNAASKASLLNRVGGNIGRYRGALKIPNMQPWAKGIKAAADADGARVAGNVLKIQNLTPTRLSALLNQDTELAKLAAMTRELRKLSLDSAEYWKLVDVEFLINYARGTNAANTLIQVKDLPKNFHTISDFVNYGPFSARPS